MKAQKPTGLKQHRITKTLSVEEAYRFETELSHTHTQASAHNTAIHTGLSGGFALFNYMSAKIRPSQTTPQPKPEPLICTARLNTARTTIKTAKKKWQQYPSEKDKHKWALQEEFYVNKQQQIFFKMSFSGFCYLSVSRQSQTETLTSTCCSRCGENVSIPSSVLTAQGPRHMWIPASPQQAALWFADRIRRLTMPPSDWLLS